MISKEHRQYIPVVETNLLLEVCLGSVGLEDATSLLLDPAWERELDVGVVHLLDQRTTSVLGSHGLASDDLDGVSSGSVSGSHVPVK